MFLFTYLQKYTFIHFLLIASLVLGSLYLEKDTIENNYCNMSCIYKLAWIFPIPYTLITFLGLLIPEPQQKQGLLDIENFNSKVYVCTVTKGNNTQAIQRVINSMKYLCSYSHTKFIILTDDNEYTKSLKEIIPNQVGFCITPKDFKTHKAKYKSRALEYFRITHNLTVNDWVLHLDEESIIDQSNFDVCLQFIMKNKYKIGQGVILYNSHNYFKNKLLTVLDSIRVTDDLGRYNFQYKILHKPIFGYHGSFLLLNGEVENKVTWDHEHSDNLTEDFSFAMKSWEYECGCIQAVIREVSPNNLIDFFKQRRRWFIGILTLPYCNAKLLAILWMLGVITIISTYFHFIFSIYYNFFTPMWISIISVFSFIISIYLYLYGIFIQTIDWCIESKKGCCSSILTILYHLLICIICIPVCPIIEACCIIYSIIKPPKSFDVINKS